MSGTDRYVHEAWRVRAKQFTGDNFPEVERFLLKHLGEECGPRYEYDPNDQWSYNIVQFYAWNDDRELDPGMWVVIHRSDNGRDGEIMCSEEFDVAYREVNK